MSEQQLADLILVAVRAAGPLYPADLHDAMRCLGVGETDARRAVLDLCDRGRLRVTTDRMLAAPVTPAGALSPCPWCGTDPLDYARPKMADHAVECVHCIAKVYAPTRAEAVAKWNRRTTPLAWSNGT